MFVCYLIKSAFCRESARDAQCQLRDSGARFLEWCRSPSCLAAEKRDVLRSVSVGRHAIFTFINRPFHSRSLADLMHAMPVKRVGDANLEGCRPPSCPAAGERASLLLAGPDAIFDHSCST